MSWATHSDPEHAVLDEQKTVAKQKLFRRRIETEGPFIPKTTSIKLLCHQGYYFCAYPCWHVQASGERCERCNRVMRWMNPIPKD